MSKPGSGFFPKTGVETNRDYLFVYGTLRRAFDHPMHQLLSSHADFIGIGRFQGKLYDLGNFPGAVASEEPSDQVKGELYVLHEAGQTFRALDEYEGKAFRRAQVAIRSEDGQEIRSWIYLYNRPVSRQRVITSGDFANHRG